MASYGLRVGDVLQLSAGANGIDTLTDLDIDPPVVWSSSQPMVAAVDSKGRVTAVSEGAVRVGIRRPEESGDPTAYVYVIVVPRIDGVKSTPSMIIWGGTTCALAEDGKMYCWGEHGLAMRDTFRGISLPFSYAVEANLFAERFVQSDGGYFQACGVTSAGTLMCWLGDFPPGALLGFGEGVERVGVGTYHYCTIMKDRRVKCVGYDTRPFSWLVEDGSETDGSGDVAVNGIADAVAISAGGDHTCAVTAGGDVLCWGDNSHGELGDGTTVGRAGAMKVNGLQGPAQDVGCGEDVSCVLATDGSVSCWGNVAPEWLTDKGATDRTKPFRIEGLQSGVRQISVGYAACALLHTGQVRCWGPAYPAYGTTPGDIALDSKAVSVTVGSRHACAVLDTGGIQCWGDRSAGRLGGGDIEPEDISLPVRVIGFEQP